MIEGAIYVMLMLLPLVVVSKMSRRSIHSEDLFNQELDEAERVDLVPW